MTKPLKERYIIISLLLILSYNQRQENLAADLRLLGQQRREEARRLKEQVNMVEMMVIIELLTGIQKGGRDGGNGKKGNGSQSPQVIRIIIIIMIIIFISLSLHEEREEMVARITHYQDQIENDQWLTGSF